MLQTVIFSFDKSSAERKTIVTTFWQILQEKEMTHNFLFYQGNNNRVYACNFLRVFTQNQNRNR